MKLKVKQLQSFCCADTELPGSLREGGESLGALFPRTHHPGIAKKERERALLLIFTGVGAKRLQGRHITVRRRGALLLCWCSSGVKRIK